MKRRFSRLADDRGQTLVWVAVGMVVLLGIVALAVDVGHLYAERRHMQNAADAGALEAARARCFDGVTKEAAAIKGQDFTTAKNSRPDAISQTYPVVWDPSNDWQFIATATENTPTYFARVFGINQVTVQATAKAACGPSPVVCGLFPLAFSQSIWNQVKDKCGQTFYVWTSDDDKRDEDEDPGGGPKKTPTPGGPTPTPIPPPSCKPLGACDCTKVWVKNKREDGAIAIPDVGRAWVDLSSSLDPSLNPPVCQGLGGNGCGAAELKCWIGSSSPVPISKGACVSGDSGNKLGVRNEVNAVAGKFVNILIFDSTCTPSGTGACKEGFHVADFGCVQVETWPNQKVELSTDGLKPGPKNLCFSGHMMPVKVGCDKCDNTCGRTPGGGDPGSGVPGVSLIK